MKNERTQADVQSDFVSVHVVVFWLFLRIIKTWQLFPVLLCVKHSYSDLI